MSFPGGGTLCVSHGSWGTGRVHSPDSAVAAGGGHTHLSLTPPLCSSLADLSPVFSLPPPTPAPPTAMTGN